MIRATVALIRLHGLIGRERQISSDTFGTTSSSPVSRIVELFKKKILNTKNKFRWKEMNNIRRGKTRSTPFIVNVYKANKKGYSLGRDGRGKEKKEEEEITIVCYLDNRERCFFYILLVYTFMAAMLILFKDLRLIRWVLTLIRSGASRLSDTRVTKRTRERTDGRSSERNSSRHSCRSEINYREREPVISCTDGLPLSRVCDIRVSSSLGENERLIPRSGGHTRRSRTVPSAESRDRPK